MPMTKVSECVRLGISLWNFVKERIEPFQCFFELFGVLLYFFFIFIFPGGAISHQC